MLHAAQTLELRALWRAGRLGSTSVTARSTPVAIGAWHTRQGYASIGERHRQTDARSGRQFVLELPSSVGRGASKHESPELSVLTVGRFEIRVARLSLPRP